MEIKIVPIDGVQFAVPAACGIPFDHLIDFPDSCGPGRGLGEILIPETVFGLRVSPACWIHDRSWDLAEPTWNAFHQTNNMLERNMRSIILVKSKYAILKYLRLYRPTTYFIAVDTAGSEHFWRLKRQQIQAGAWPEYTLPSGV